MKKGTCLKCTYLIRIYYCNHLDEEEIARLLYLNCVLAVVWLQLPCVSWVDLFSVSVTFTGHPHLLMVGL